MLNREIFSKRIKELRLMNNYKQKDVAQKIGAVSHSTIANLETGSTSPSLELVLKLADLYGVTIDYLVGRSNVPWPISDQVIQIAEKTDLTLEELHLLLEDVIRQEDPKYQKIKKMIAGLDEESMEDLKKYLQFLHIRQTLDKKNDEKSAGSEGK